MNRHCNRRGFTLVELLVALGISGVLILSCGVMLRMGSEGRLAIARELAWEREAARLTEQLNEDLAAAHHSLWHEGGGGNSCMFGWMRLNTLQSQAGRGAIGDLCAVGYTLDDRSLGPNRIQRCLLRQQYDSADVFEAIATEAVEGLWDSTPTAEPLVQGVLVFELWPLLRDGPESWQPWHPELRAMPQAVELRLVLAAPDLQERLRTSEDWNRAAWDLDQFDGGEIRELQTLILLGTDAH